VFNEIVENIVENSKNVYGMHGIIEEDIEDDLFGEQKEADEQRLFVNDIDYSKESNITKRNMVLLEQNVDPELNKEEGWSNPTLSNNKELNIEVVYYQSIIDKLEDCSEEDDKEVLLEKLNMSFRRIAGYYSNYEYRWYQKMGNLFEEPELFYDFFYDLLRDCITGFDPGKKSKVYEHDYRKAKSGVYFNQYFFGALSKRKITNLKKTANTSNKPSITCEICGEKVTRITEFHLRHEYDESRIRKDFKVFPVKVNGQRCYKECPICNEINVPISHVKKHRYARHISAAEYIDRFPGHPLHGSIRSLQEPITCGSGDNSLTYEDIYGAVTEYKNDEIEMSLLFSRINDVLGDDEFISEIVRLKVLDYKDSEIAEKLGDSCVFKIDYELSKDMRKKSDIYKYVRENMGDVDFFKKHNKFHIVSRKKDDNMEVFHVSSYSPSQICLAIKKLRSNKRKIKELFGDVNVPTV